MKQFGAQSHSPCGYALLGSPIGAVVLQPNQGGVFGLEVSPLGHTKLNDRREGRP